MTTNQDVDLTKNNFVLVLLVEYQVITGSD